jgi:hypothetical protein
MSRSGIRPHQFHDEDEAPEQQQTNSYREDRAYGRQQAAAHFTKPG